MSVDVAPTLPASARRLGIAHTNEATSGNFVSIVDEMTLTSSDMSKAMPLGCIRDDEQAADHTAVLPRRTPGRSCVPEPGRPVVSLADPDLLRAVLAGLARLPVGGVR